MPVNDSKVAETWNKVIVMDPPTLAMVEVPVEPIEDMQQIAIDTGAHEVSALDNDEITSSKYQDPTGVSGTDLTLTFGERIAKHALQGSTASEQIVPTFGK